MLQFFGIVGAFLVIWGIFRIIGPYRASARTRPFEGYSIVQVEGPEESGLQLIGSAAKAASRSESISLDLPIGHSEEYYFYTGLGLIALGSVPVVIQVKGHIIIPKLQVLFEYLRAAL